MMDEMPEKIFRTPLTRTRGQRLAQMRQGPGVFVYLGTHMDHECTPTKLKHNGKNPVLDDNGMPVTDQKTGEQVFYEPGRDVLDSNGQPMLGGPPKVEWQKQETKTVRGVDFPEGEKIAVNSPSLALKLRGMASFQEVISDGDSRGDLLDEVKARDSVISKLEEKLAKSTALLEKLGERLESLEDEKKEKAARGRPKKQ